MRRMVSVREDERHGGERGEKMKHARSGWEQVVKLKGEIDRAQNASGKICEYGHRVKRR